MFFARTGLTNMLYILEHFQSEYAKGLILLSGKELGRFLDTVDGIRKVLSIYMPNRISGSWVH